MKGALLLAALLLALSAVWTAAAGQEGALDARGAVVEGEMRAMRTEYQSGFDRLSAEIRASQAEFRGEIQALRGEVRASQAELEARMVNRFALWIGLLAGYMTLLLAFFGSIFPCPGMTTGRFVPSLSGMWRETPRRYLLGIRLAGASFISASRRTGDFGRDGSDTGLGWLRPRPNRGYSAPTAPPPCGERGAV